MQYQAQEEIILIKGKRSKRKRQRSPLSLTMAGSSSTTVELSGGGGIISDFSGGSDLVTPSDSNSGELTQEEEDEDMANCLILLAKGLQTLTPAVPPAAAAAEVYDCKTCSRSFSSFQALGGHRASHNKPNKPLTLDEKIKPLNPNVHHSTILSLEISSKVSGNPKIKSRVHECSICGAEFASGQALGGHMRRHRPTTAAGNSSHGESQEAKRLRGFLPLDLNLPAPEDDQMESRFTGFVMKEQVMVVSGSNSLVDCHY